MSELTAEARELADQLADGDHIAMLDLPSAALARKMGVRPALWQATRQAALVSAGRAISELRSHGWELEVETLRDASPDVDTVIVVHALGIPAATADG